MKLYRSIINRLGRFGVSRMSSYVSPLKEEIMKSNMGILYEIYVGKMIFYSLLLSSAAFIAVTIGFPVIFGIPPLYGIVSGFIMAVTVLVASLLIAYSYPFQTLTSKKQSIETNMPFAINHMAAVASSGVPPFVIFKLLMNVHEYGEISNEFRRIVRNVDVFGMDIIAAVKNVADRTPSEEFKQFMYGFISNTSTGGDLRKYLENSSKEALFDYKLRREKYLQTLSTYADFYTAVLIAAPLFFVSILSVMSLIGGQVVGLSIPTAMRLGIYILMPVLNIAFIMFIHYTQPKV